MWRWPQPRSAPARSTPPPSSRERRTTSSRSARTSREQRQKSNTFNNHKTLLQTETFKTLIRLRHFLFFATKNASLSVKASSYSIFALLCKEKCKCQVIWPQVPCHTQQLDQLRDLLCVWISVPPRTFDFGEEQTSKNFLAKGER